MQRFHRKCAARHSYYNTVPQVCQAQLYERRHKQPGIVIKFIMCSCFLISISSSLLTENLVDLSIKDTLSNVVDVYSLDRNHSCLLFVIQTTLYIVRRCQYKYQ